MSTTEDSAAKLFERLTFLSLVVAADLAALVPHDVDAVHERLVTVEVVSCEGEGD